MTGDKIAVDADLRASVEQFYAHHMQLLDAGRIEEWAAFFTEDGTFTVDSHPVPARGRQEIVAGASRTVEQLREQSIARRHWLGMSDLTPEDDGTTTVRSYALVFQITEADGPALRSSTICEDVLVRDGGSWLIRARLVRQDRAA
ncbi:nuclear transport factor 2 family protein [Kitasatospora sp. NPDC058218]|uniref:nuclear transport factor 2 family protein n=1 Tax=Kitasatospora sp. NPDC058218 TaxID=3346385 RepID=UPI0036DBAFD0